MLRQTTLMMLLGLAATAGCGSLQIVPNPKYEGWANFGVGSYVTLEGVEIFGRDRQPFRITERLMAVTEDQVELELTVVYFDGDEPTESVVTRQWLSAVIFASESPLTHPDADIAEQGSETVVINDEPFECRVIEINLDTQLLLLGQKLFARLHLSESIPGGVVQAAEATTTTDRFYQFEKRVVDFQIVEQ